ncbi:hypothetical protein LXL04_038902 [Taraxacum kok-saghyz]
MLDTTISSFTTVDTTISPMTCFLRFNDMLLPTLEISVAPCLLKMSALPYQALLLMKDSPKTVLGFSPQSTFSNRRVHHPIRHHFLHQPASPKKILGSFICSLALEYQKTDFINIDDNELHMEYRQTPSLPSDHRKHSLYESSGLFDNYRTRTRTQTTDHRPRTTDRVRHQRLLPNTSDSGPSPTSEANFSVCDFFGRTESEAKGRTESVVRVRRTLSNAQTTDRVRGPSLSLQSEEGMDYLIGVGGFVSPFYPWLPWVDHFNIMLLQIQQGYIKSSIEIGSALTDILFKQRPIDKPGPQ